MFAGVGIWQLLIVAVIVVLIFGTKRIKQAGGDVGAAIKGIKEGFGSDSLEDVASEVVEAKKELDKVHNKIREL